MRNEIKIPTVKTGDVLACHGRGFYSWAIGWLTPRLCFWRRVPSHVAIVVVRNSVPYVFESTTLSVIPDDIDGELRIGVQAHLLANWLRAYNGYVDLYRLCHRLTSVAEQRAVTHAEKCHKDHLTYSVSAAIASATPAYNPPEQPPLFCASFLCDVLKAAWQVSTDLNCNERQTLDVIRFPFLSKPERIK